MDGAVDAIVSRSLLFASWPASFMFPFFFAGCSFYMYAFPPIPSDMWHITAASKPFCHDTYASQATARGIETLSS